MRPRFAERQRAWEPRRGTLAARKQQESGRSTGRGAAQKAERGKHQQRREGKRRGTAAPPPGAPMEPGPPRWGGGRQEPGPRGASKGDRSGSPQPSKERPHYANGGDAGRDRAGEKAAKGATGRAAQGAGAARCPRRAAFFSHSLAGVGTPAAHCGAGPHAGRRRGPHGDAPSRPRGPPARHATAGP